MQGALTGLLLPPLLLVLLALMAGLLAWRGRRAMGALAAGCAALLLLLSTPFVAGSLAVAVARLAPAGPAIKPAAIIVLGGEMARGAAGVEVGPLTLERLRAGAALHRRTGLPLLVTGGPAMRGAPPIAELMAASLREDFGVPVRWVEPGARDTRDNAVLSAAMLRADGIEAAHLVTHAWHMPRSLGAFARASLPVAAAPVRQEAQPEGAAGDWLPRPDHLARSWFMLREAAGLAVYRIRDSN
ncbi:MAG TPA: YdcF family protein [Falsiroseomonas sp.]|jgi:uncharacterized SAM-binding protein YcdF (DUF218 family)|nr:YdcF family protein [Falsiroseomonas sp.]